MMFELSEKIDVIGTNVAALHLISGLFPTTLRKYCVTNHSHRKMLSNIR